MEYLKISESTIKRYEKNEKTPKAIIECLLMIGGQLPNFAKKNDFSGWSFSSGYLYSPEGNRYTSGDIRAIYSDRELIKELTRNMKTLREKEKQKIKNNIYKFPEIHKDFIKLNY